VAVREPNEVWFIEEDPSVRTAEPGEYLFHYTTLAAALEHILPTRRLRFSKFSTMRDPRESKWAFAASLWGEEEGTELYFKTLATLDHLKETVRIISFTADDETQAFVDGVFARGFSHPRLWEQYADDHRGVCLCFKKDPLIQEATRQDRELRHGPVVYRNGSIDLHATSVDLNRVQTVGAEATLEEHLAGHFDELFFTKLRDWETEVEYRLATRFYEDDLDIYLDVSASLDSVILGALVARQYGPAFEALCEPKGPDLFQMQWSNGRPMIIRYSPTLARRKITPPSPSP
jgi:hypothetical protein